MALVSNDLALLQGLYTGGAVYADEMLVYHISGGWATQPAVHGNIIAISPPSGDLVVMSASSDDGSVYQLDTGATRDGLPMGQVLLTPWIDFGSPAHRKWVRRIVLETDSDATDIAIEVAVDYSDHFTGAYRDPGAASRVRWLPAGDPAAVRWLRKTDPACAVWRSDSAKRTIDFPTTIHCKAIRLRISGEALKIVGVGIGWRAEGA